MHSDSGVSEVLIDEQLAVVVCGDKTEFQRVTSAIIQRVQENASPQIPTTQLPTEAGWAREIAELCEWSVKAENSEK